MWAWRLCFQLWSLLEEEMEPLFCIWGYCCGVAWEQGSWALLLQFQLLSLYYKRKQLCSVLEEEVQPSVSRRMVQAVDPTRRGAPLDHGKGEGFRPQHSLLASADLWILEVLRAQEIPCSFFLLGFGFLWVWMLLWGADDIQSGFSNLRALWLSSPAFLLLKNENAFGCMSW